MDDCIYTAVALSRVGCALYIHRRRKRRGLRGLQPPHSPFFWGGGHSPHFCRIINNFLNFTTFNSLGLKNTILESSSTRLVCFGQQTTYVVSWFGTFHFFICHPSRPHPTPPPPLWKAILFSFWCRHHWRLHPRGKNVVGVFKKKITKTSFYCLWGRGGRRKEMEWSTGLRTRACAFNLQVPYPRSNSGKRTFVFSAATLFNCLDTDLKQIACVSPSSIIFSSRLNNFKHKLFILFLKFASNVSHLEELMCYDCRFSLYCNFIRR